MFSELDLNIANLKYFARIYMCKNNYSFYKEIVHLRAFIVLLYYSLKSHNIIIVMDISITSSKGKYDPPPSNTDTG